MKSTKKPAIGFPAMLSSLKTAMSHDLSNQFWDPQNVVYSLSCAKDSPQYDFGPLVGDGASYSAIGNVEPKTYGARLLRIRPERKPVEVEKLDYWQH